MHLELERGMLFNNMNIIFQIAAQGARGVRLQRVLPLINQRRNTPNNSRPMGRGHSAPAVHPPLHNLDFKPAVMPLPENSAGNITVKLFFPKTMFPDFPVHPHVERAQKATEAFALRHGLYTDIFPRFQDMKFAWLSGFAYSTPTFLQEPEKLLIASDWITALFSHDDAIDGLDTAQEEHSFERLNAINDRLIAIVNTPTDKLARLKYFAASPREKAMAEVYLRLMAVPLKSEMEKKYQART